VVGCGERGNEPSGSIQHAEEPLAYPEGLCCLELVAQLTATEFAHNLVRAGFSKQKGVTNCEFLACRSSLT